MSEDQASIQENQAEQAALPNLYGNLDPEAYLHLQQGLALFKEKNVTEAEEEFVKAIEIAPDLAPLYNVFALLKLSQRAIDSLKESVYLAMTTNPEFMDDFVKEGAELLAKGRFDEAEERFRKAIALNPNNIDAHFRLGFLYLSQKNLEKAIEVFERLIQLDPENINAFFMLGMAYSEIRDYYPAISNLQYALRLHPEFVEARLTLADAYHNQGKYLISLNELTALQAFIPDEDTTYLHRGLIMMELERYTEAIPYFEQAIAKNPYLQEGYELLTGLYENTGKMEQALITVEAGLQHFPENQELVTAHKRLKPAEAESQQSTG